jgi:hypothetical protein
MRALVFFLVACGSTPQKSPLSSSAPPDQAVVSDAPMNCESSVEDSKPGNHDRFAFESPDGRYGYKDGKGNVVIAPTLNFAYEFKPGGIAAVVDANAQFAFIDPTGKRIARAYAFDNGPDYFQEGFARIVDDHKKIGFMSDRGVIIAPQFDSAESFCNGKAQVTRNNETFSIDRSGKRVD